MTRPTSIVALHAGYIFVEYCGHDWALLSFPARRDRELVISLFV